MMNNLKQAAVYVAAFVVAFAVIRIGSGLLSGEYSTSDSDWAEIRQGFMEGCNDDGASYAFCSCSFNYMERTYGRERMVRVFTEFYEAGDNAPLPDETTGAIDACIYLME